MLKGPADLSVFAGPFLLAGPILGIYSKVGPADQQISENITYRESYNTTYVFYVVSIYLYGSIFCWSCWSFLPFSYIFQGQYGTTKIIDELSTPVEKLPPIISSQGSLGV